MIPVNEPLVSKQAKKYVNDALDTGWISSAGSYVQSFEQQFADYIGVSHAATCSNGTTALHLAIAALNIGPGDEVIVPDLTIISCAFAVMYAGATPVFADVDKATGNIDPSLIEEKISPQTKAIMVVHLYGQPVDMDPIKDIAAKHKLKIIEDAAESHGAEYKGKKTGSLGDIATFSFYGNKIITTGEGGMVTSNDSDLIQKVNTLKNLAHTPGKRFHHQQIGYNYRLTNIQAALGLGHLESIDTYLAQKQHMQQLYHSLLKDIPHIHLPQQQSNTTSVYWMYNILVSIDSPISRDQLVKKLNEQGVQTRTYFYPLHQQPVIAAQHPQQDAYPVSSDLSQRGLYLPSGLALTDEQIHQVSKVLHGIFKN